MRVSTFALIFLSSFLQHAVLVMFIPALHEPHLPQIMQGDEAHLLSTDPATLSTKVEHGVNGIQQQANKILAQLTRRDDMKEIVQSGAVVMLKAYMTIAWLYFKTWQKGKPHLNGKAWQAVKIHSTDCRAFGILQRLFSLSYFYLKKAYTEERSMIDAHLQSLLPGEYWVGLKHIREICRQVFEHDTDERILGGNEVRKKAKWFEMNTLASFPNDLLHEEIGAHNKVKERKNQEFLEWRQNIIDLHIFLNGLEDDLPAISEYTRLTTFS